MDHRSPLESFFGVIGSLPQGHDKPVKQAVYNAVALFLLFLSCVAGLALYLILEPFVKPLMWALLVGSALHPLKRSLRDTFRAWLQNLEDTNTPTVLGLVLLPMNIFNQVAECIGQFLWDHIKLILTITILIPLAILVYNFTPRTVVSLLWISTLWVYKSLNFVISNSTLTLVSLLIIAYLTVVFFFWNQDNNVKFHYASTIVWLLGSCGLSSQFSFQMPVFILLQIIFFGGFISEVYDAYTTMNAAEHGLSFTEVLSIAFHDKPIDLDLSEENDSVEKMEPSEKNLKLSSPSVKFSETLQSGNSDTTVNQISDDPWSLELFNESKQTPKVETPEPATGVLITNHGIHLVQTSDASSKKPRPKFQRSLSQPHFASSRYQKSSLLNISRKISLRNCSLEETSYESTFYLYSVMWCCLVMLFWKNIMLLPLLPLPILYYVIKHTGVYLGLWSYLFQKFCIIFDRLSDWCWERHDALVPVPIRGLYKVVHKVNAMVKSSIKNSIDTVASAVVIVGLIVFLICASIFTAVQIYAEGIMLVQMTSNVINQTVVQNPELRQLLPPTWDETMDSLLDNAYQYGREGISKAVKSVMNDADSVQSEKLEKQILELWDRIYQSWMTNHDGNGPKVTGDAVHSSWQEFMRDIQKSPVSEIFNVNGIIDFAQQNVGMLVSVLESIWSIVISNITLVIGSFSTCLSIVLGGGTAVLNFILNMVVFLTTLFYLLNSSGEYYKPVELMTKFSQGGKRFGHALEAAINSVFSASLKMAAFYGLWTWFIHNLFNVQIVYLSSAFATILGAVPFLGTYWACVPGILDLWLSQDRWICALLFATCQFLPTYIVDATIYKEIKGGHPYLTGLAIAGGIFCMGMEGAIIGPMLLCGLYVATDLSSNLFKESPMEDSINLGLH
ncbi:transmembrane protein 245 [Euwallacea similis]|uniref:transmembrane protein 245 n=1 Tax=Euwallacea similis TaxID=1736056 RepID=UPI0034502488